VCREYAAWACGEERLHALWQSWKADRKARGEDLYARPWLVRRWLARAGIEDQEAVVGFWAYCWVRKDEHLCQYAIDSQRRFENRRDALFRREAIRIATDYAEVTVDNYRISDMKELPVLTLPGDPPRDQAQHNAQAAAPGRFREILAEVMGPRCTPCERKGDAKTAGGARKRKTVSSGADRQSPSDDIGCAAE